MYISNSNILLDIAAVLTNSTFPGNNPHLSRAKAVEKSKSAYMNMIQLIKRDDGANDASMCQLQERHKYFDTVGDATLIETEMLRVFVFFVFHVYVFMTIIFILVNSRQCRYISITVSIYLDCPMESFNKRNQLKTVGRLQEAFTSVMLLEMDLLTHDD